MNTPDELLLLWCLWAASVGSLSALALMLFLRSTARG